MTATNCCSTAAAPDADGAAVAVATVLEVEVVRACPPHPPSASPAENSASAVATSTGVDRQSLGERGDQSIDSTPPLHHFRARASAGSTDRRPYSSRI